MGSTEDRDSGASGSTPSGNIRSSDKRRRRNAVQGKGGKVEGKEGRERVLENVELIGADLGGKSYERLSHLLP
ncbi:hypothetical protein H6P81_016024 [Aristolochia fimbriata]|uniref:Uncharacterized protein n=1 Tax=Aristolochia fimbriata TaxID=158543 RepID=A0AAV7E8W6_ARIFI|nr:hypothetical protein H6P81_016024 [Aristolochia fimbriata]